MDFILGYLQIILGHEIFVQILFWEIWKRIIQGYGIFGVIYYGVLDIKYPLPPPPLKQTSYIWGLK